MEFNADGTKMYVLDADLVVLQYALSAPYDISSPTLEAT
jgi:hypothetical protein